jgi:hypothetical protein
VPGTVLRNHAGLFPSFEGRYSFENDVSAKKASLAQVRFEGDISKQNGDQVQLAKARSSDVINFSKDGYGSISRSIKSSDGTENVVLTLEGMVFSQTKFAHVGRS